MGWGGLKLALGELLGGDDPRLEPCGRTAHSSLQQALTDKGWRRLAGGRTGTRASQAKTPQVQKLKGGHIRAT